MARHLPTPVPAPPLALTARELGVLVRNARARAQLRIDDAAALAGVSSDLLSRLEHGKAVGSDKLLAVLSSLGLAMLVTDKRRADRLVSQLMREESCDD